MQSAKQVMTVKEISRKTMASLNSLATVIDMACLKN